ncbi:MAG TPA: arginine--tRNA ligase [Mycobacteriales bacterium]|jgi:arginyl-tRNA synthetase|nr:arginine--tRNA ligase [Mycobacteriales bacterium]
MTPADLAAAVIVAAREAARSGELAIPAEAIPTHTKVERPRQAGHGDYASSLALQLAKPAGRPPREVAEVLAGRLRKLAGISKVEVAGPGFLNLTVGAAALGEVARAVVTAGESFGGNTALAGERINLEFVSSNPTGPIHIGAVRWAAVGDALGRILTASGAQVAREYYFNDHGAQVDRFARSLLAAARGEPTPEDGYGGAYIAEIAARVERAVPGVAQLSDDQAAEVFRREGVNLMFTEIKASLRDFGVNFDVFFHEDDLHTSGRVEEAIARLRTEGHVYDQDGAVWLRTSDFGDDKDRVLVRSNGEPAYFSGDVAYYLDKRERGFDRVVIMLGADHSGYLGRLRAMVACFGEDPDRRLEVLIGQLVNLVRDGQPVRLSKRAGNVVTLEDLVEAVGVDAARYSLARASSDSQIDLDLNLLAKQASDNPVFYVQYAATRAASILRNAAEMGLPPRAPQQVDVSVLTHPREQDLLLAIGEFPGVVASAAELREPHRIARYLEEQVAKAVQRFWDDCPVLPRGDEPVTEITHARLLLWQAARTVLANGLGLLGVSAPERM